MYLLFKRQTISQNGLYIMFDPEAMIFENVLSNLVVNDKESVSFTYLLHNFDKFLFELKCFLTKIFWIYFALLNLKVLVRPSLS